MRAIERLLATRSAFVLLSLALLAAAMLAAFVLFGPLLGASLGLVDDHEIVRYLGADHVLPLTEIPRRLLDDTELGQWGSYTRLRPVYYVLRMLETSIDTDDAARWYLVRLIIVGLSSWGVGMIALAAGRRRAKGAYPALSSALIALLATALIVSLPAWSDIAMRLGPSEIYLMADLVLVTAGAVVVWRDPRSLAAWTAVVLGYIVVSGSKENGLLLAVPLLVLLVFRFRAARGKPYILVLVGAAAVFSAYVGLGVVLGSLANRGDVYGESRSLIHFLAAIPGSPYLFAIALGLVVAVVAARGAEPTPAGASRMARARAWLEARPLVLAGLALLFIGLGETFFYQNNVTPNGFVPARYGLVAEYAAALAVVVALFAVSAVETRARTRRYLWAGAAVLLLLLPTAGGQVLTALETFRPRASAIVAETNAVHAEMIEGIQAVQEEPGTQVLVIADDVSDFERVFAVGQYLAYYGAADTSFLRVDIDTGDALASSLAHKLKDMAAAGDSASGWRVAPISGFDEDARTVCFAFGAVPVDAQDCESVHVLG